MKTVSFIFFFICCRYLVFGQKEIVFCDAENREHIECVRVIGKDTNGKKLFTLQSDSLGKLTILKEYRLKIKCIIAERIGYKNLSVDSIDERFLADTLFLESNTWLKETIVKGHHSLYKVMPDKIVYSVEADSSMQSKNSFEALMRAPLLMVNRNGNIRSVGDKTIEYKLNGVRDPLLSTAIQNVLNGLPAKYLKRIEVSTEQTAEGVDKMIVNIVSKGKLYGYRGSVSSSLSDNSWRNVIWGLTKVKRICISSSYANYWFFDHTSELFNDEYRYTSTDLYNYQREYYNEGFKSDNHNFEISLSYDIDDNTLLSGFGRVMLKTNPHEYASERGLILNNSGGVTASYNKENRREVDDAEYSVSLAIERLFNNQGDKGKFYLGYNFYSRPLNNTTQESYSDLYLNETNKDLGEDFFDYYRSKKSYENWHTLETDYRRKINKAHKIEFCAKLRYRDEAERQRKNDYFRFSPSYKERADSSSFSYSQIYGFANLTYEYQTAKLNARMGAGAQYFHEYLYRRELNDKFYGNDIYMAPFGRVSYVMSHALSFEVGYSLSKSVPNVYALNPYVDSTQPGRITYGNPHLKPEQTHSVGLSSNVNKGRVYAQFSLNNSFSNDLILEHSFLEKDMIHVTKDNLGKRYVGSINMFASSKCTKTTYVKVNTSVNYTRYSASTINQKNDGYSFHINGSLNQELPLGVDLDVSGGYNSDYIYLQGKGGENFYYELSLYRTFFNRRLSVNCSASSFIPIRHKRTYEYSSEGYYSRQVNKKYHAAFLFTLRYTFGKLKANVKRTDKSIDNDDIKYNYDE